MRVRGEKPAEVIETEPGAALLVLAELFVLLFALTDVFVLRFEFVTVRLAFKFDWLVNERLSLFVVKLVLFVFEFRPAISQKPAPTNSATMTMIRIAKDVLFIWI